MHTISYLPPPFSLLDDEPPTAFGKHDHGDATTCSCLSPHARQRLLGKGPVDLHSLNALCTAPPLFRLWFFRRRGLFLSPPTCPSHPGVVMAPTVVGGERVLYRYGLPACSDAEHTGFYPSSLPEKAPLFLLHPPLHSLSSHPPSLPPSHSQQDASR